MIRRRSRKTFVGVEVRGTPAFLAQAEDALELLSATRYFGEIRRFAPAIREGSRSGMKAYGREPLCVVARPTWEHSAVWLASVIAHESRHAKLYHTAKTQGGNREPPAETWTGIDAEKQCLAFQREVLRELDAERRVIDYVSGLQENPCYQGRSHGWRSWWDYFRRWW